MSIEIGKKVLITTDHWFYAPNGRSYRAVFGTVHKVESSEEALGIKTNSKSTNWYVEIGNMLIAGCQIHYAVQTDKCNDGLHLGWDATAADGLKKYKAPCAIYFADKPEVKESQLEAAK